MSRCCTLLSVGLSSSYCGISKPIVAGVGFELVRALIAAVTSCCRTLIYFISTASTALCSLYDTNCAFARILTSSFRSLLRGYIRFVASSAGFCYISLTVLRPCKVSVVSLLPLFVFNRFYGF